MGSIELITSGSKYMSVDAKRKIILIDSGSKIHLSLRYMFSFCLESRLL